MCDRVLEQVGAADTQTVDATTAKTFTAPDGARGFYISCATADIWIRWDATAAANAGLRISASKEATYIAIPKTFTAFGAGASCPTSVIWVK